VGLEGKVRWEDASLGELPVPREADWSEMRGETAASGEEQQHEKSGNARQ